MRRCRGLIGTVAALVVAPAAQAHLQATGLGPVYDGTLHFLTSPEDLVPTLALVNGSGVGWSAAGLVALLGVASTVFVCCVLAAALVTRLRAQWARIAVRVAGSWIAAVGLLMAGWALRAG